MLRVKRLALSLLLVVTSSCSGASWLIHPIDTSSRGFGELDKTPQLLVRLGQAQQVCLPDKEDYIPIDIFIQLRNLPAQPVKVQIDGVLNIDNLYGTSAVVHLRKVGEGHHLVVVEAGGLTYSLPWAVYACPPQVKGELYKPDGRGLKGYCPECPVCPTKEELCTTQP